MSGPHKSKVNHDDKWHYERLHSKLNSNTHKTSTVIGGGDEAGRGCLAGPVVAAIVLLDINKPCDERINDSKKLLPLLREELYRWITKNALAYSIATVNAKIIDEINILQATKVAFKKAFLSLSIRPNLLLLDAIDLPEIPIAQISIVKGDSKSYSIAAASILAKVYRDRLMVKYSKLYEQYQFEKHKGYGVKSHLEKLSSYGPCRLHRYSYKPVQKAVELQKTKNIVA